MEEVEKSFSNVVKKMYLSKSKVQKMKESMGKMKEMSKVNEVEMDED